VTGLISGLGRLVPKEAPLNRTPDSVLMFWRGFPAYVILH